MLRDIDYAAAAVKTVIIEKFGRQNELQGLRVTANDKTISVDDEGRTAEGTRDALLAAMRKANDYEQLWQLMPKDAKP
jgi:hypothetical protein